MRESERGRGGARADRKPPSTESEAREATPAASESACGVCSAAHVGGVGNPLPALLGVVLGSSSELSGGEGEENVTTGSAVLERNERTVRSADGDVPV